MVTSIIVHDFERKKSCVANFVNKQTLYHSVGDINSVI